MRALLVEAGPSNADALSVYHRAGFADTKHVLLKIELSDPVHAAKHGG